MNHQLPPKTNPEAIVTADIYDEATREGGWDSPKRAQKLVEKYISEGSVVLDLGIGTGQAIKGYSEKGATVIGFDHDPEMLEAAQAVTGESGYMHIADINGGLPVESIEDKVDVAQAVGVLEFANDLGSVLDQIKSTLKSGGVFVFTIETTTENDNATEHFTDVGVTIHRHSADEVHSLLKEREFNLLFDEAYDGYERGDVGSDMVPYRIFLAQK